MPQIRRISLVSVLSVVISWLSAPSAARAQPGRILSTPGNNITECNIDASKCFTVVDNGADGGSLPEGAASPSVATNGTIAFSALYGLDGSCASPCNPHIFAMNADGTNVRQLTFNPANTSSYNGEYYATISPDGTMVVFLSNRNPAPDGSHSGQIYLVNTDGSNLHQLTAYMADQSGANQGVMYGLAWSPDSKTVAFRGVVYTSRRTPDLMEFGVIPDCDAGTFLWGGQSWPRAGFLSGSADEVGRFGLGAFSSAFLKHPVKIRSSESNLGAASMSAGATALSRVRSFS